MVKNHKQLNSLQEAIHYYSDESVCIEEVSRRRWADGKPECPACGGADHYWLATQRRWKCKDCWKQFSVKVGTVFEDSALSLTKWLPALWLLVNCKNGISSYELGKALRISQKSAWFMLHRLRTALHEDDLPTIGGPDSGPIEVDETFVGGKIKNMHRKVVREKFKGIPSQAHNQNKAIVMGMRDRETRQVRAKVIPNTRRDTLQNMILENVSKKSTIHTDEAQGYYKLAEKDFVHETVNHLDEYVRGQVHTNGIENFWSLLKRGLKGTYVAVEPFHLDKYVDEQVFRYNNRGSRKEKVSDFQRFSLALSMISGKRLTFAEATGRVGEKPF